MEFDSLSLADLEAMQAAWGRKVQREDLRSGILAALLVNMFGKDKDSPPVHPADFFASLDELRPPPPTAEQMEAKLDAIFTSLGAKPLQE